MKDCFLFHDWGKWEQYVHHFTNYGFAWKPIKEGIESSELRQKRTCKKCGKMEDKLV